MTAAPRAPIPTTDTLARERALVRDLARHVADLAAAPRMAAIQQRWRDVNALRRPDRAPVYCRPIGCWPELLPDAALTCSDPWLRGWETHLRKVLVKADIGDDDPVDPWVDVGARWVCDPADVWGVPVGRHAPASATGAWAYDPPLRVPADLDRLAMPRFRLDWPATETAAGRVHELLGDILPVRVTCQAPLSATLGIYAADLLGLEPLMLAMADEPEMVHRLMAHLRDAAAAAAEVAAASGRLTANTFGPMYASDPLAPPPPDGRLGWRHCWGAANSQEYDQVSPAMWEEFCLDYQRPLLERCGLSAYGCCENLSRKIAGVLSLANLRIFVCSAWTDLDAVIAATAGRHTIMWRQKASAVVLPPDTEELARHLDDGCRRLRGLPYQIVLRELQTLAGHPRRLHEWTRLAIAAAARWA